MDVSLVIAGNYQQYMDWLNSRLKPGADQAPNLYNYVADEQGLFGHRVDNINSVHLVGEYWTNPAWGSTAYQILMQEGVMDHKPWAMEWAVDWQRAKHPVTVDDLSKARVNLVRLKRELSESWD